MNDDLLVKYLLDEASAEESAQVEQWADASEENQKYFASFISIWKESRRLALTSKVDENAAWERFRKRLSAANEEKKPAPVKSSMAWMRIAALFILLIGAATIFYFQMNNDDPAEQIALRSSDAVLTDTLPDGSVVTLNKMSSIVYPDQFEGDKRMVKLEGEAFFNVTPNKKKPFEIQVNDVTVKVIGTSFNIRSVDGMTEVIVESGIVRVTRGKQTVELRPKEKVVVSDSSQIMTPQQENEQLYQHYRSKVFVCDSTPLWKLAEVLSEAYQTKIIIEREELRNLRMDVTFSNESLDVILEIIKETYNSHRIKIDRTTDSIILR